MHFSAPYVLYSSLRAPTADRVPPHVDVVSIQHIAEFGVVMMLFLVGLELEPRMLWSMRDRLLGLGGLQVVGTAAAVTGIAMVPGQPWSVALAIGLVLSLSSTAAGFRRPWTTWRPNRSWPGPGRGQTARIRASSESLRETRGQEDLVLPAGHDCKGRLGSLLSLPDIGMRSGKRMQGGETPQFLSDAPKASRGTSGVCTNRLNSATP